MPCFSRSLRLALLSLTFVVVGTLGVAVNTVNHVRSASTHVLNLEMFKSDAQPDVGLRFVRNSGVCETTPGVNQLSGYIDFGTNMSMVRIVPTRILCGSLIPCSLYSGFGFSNLDTSPKLLPSRYGQLTYSGMRSCS